MSQTALSPISMASTLTAPTPTLWVDEALMALFDGAVSAMRGAAEQVGLAPDTLEATLHVATELRYKAQGAFTLWSHWHRQVWNGFDHPDGSIYMPSPDDALTAIKAVCDDERDGPETASSLRALVSTKPAQIFGAPTGKLPLGPVSKRFHAHVGCRTCARTGTVRCCLDGNESCTGCGGRGYNHGSSNGRYVQIGCMGCHGRGRRTCPRCYGRIYVQCNGCCGLGGFTYGYHADLSAEWTSRLDPTDEAWPTITGEIARRNPGEIVADARVSAPRWVEGKDLVTWDLSVPYLRGRYAYPHAGQTQTFTVDYVGLSAVPSPMPHGLEPLARDHADAIAACAGRDAFARADETGLGRAVAAEILQGGVAQAEAVSHGTVTPETLAQLRSTLERAAEILTFKPMCRAWIQANVAALILWACVSVVYGSAIRECLTELPPGIANGRIVLTCGGLFIGLSLLGYFWGQRAGRRALAAILGTSVRRSPEPGLVGISGGLGLLVIVTFAGSGYGVEPPTLKSQAEMLHSSR